MAEISKKTIENLRDFFSRGCDYAGTQEVVDELKYKALKKMGCEYAADEVGLEWDGEEMGTVDDFADYFWDMAVEIFLNVLKTEDVRIKGRRAQHGKETL